MPNQQETKPLRVLASVIMFISFMFMFSLILLGFLQP